MVKYSPGGIFSWLRKRRDEESWHQPAQRTEVDSRQTRYPRACQFRGQESYYRSSMEVTVCYFTLFSPFQSLERAIGWIFKKYRIIYSNIIFIITAIYTWLHDLWPGVFMYGGGASVKTDCEYCWFFLLPQTTKFSSHLSDLQLSMHEPVDNLYLHIRLDEQKAHGQ
jgi:hypothetical protein